MSCNLKVKNLILMVDENWMKLEEIWQIMVGKTPVKEKERTMEDVDGDACQELERRS